MLALFFLGLCMKFGGFDGFTYCTKLYPFFCNYKILLWDASLLHLSCKQCSGSQLWFNPSCCTLASDSIWRVMQSDFWRLVMPTVHLNSTEAGTKNCYVLLYFWLWTFSVFADILPLFCTCCMAVHVSDLGDRNGPLSFQSATHGCYLWRFI